MEGTEIQDDIKIQIHFMLKQFMQVHRDICIEMFHLTFLHLPRRNPTTNYSNWPN